MGMPELREMYMIQELNKIGFSEAKYMPETGKIMIQPDNDRMPVINGQSIDCANEYNSLVINTLWPLVNNVNEVVTAWEKSCAVDFEGASNFRLLLEYDNVVLAARNDTEKGYGFHFVTWQVNDEQTEARHGHYTKNYNEAKEDFAIRAGLIPEAKVFTLEQAAEIKTSIDFRINNDNHLTFDIENRLNEIAEKLSEAYPVKDTVAEKVDNEKNADNSCDVYEVNEYSDVLFQQLLYKINGEMNSYIDDCMKLDKSSIINLAESIGERKKVEWLFDTETYDFKGEQLEYLLNYHDLLTEFSDSLRAQIYDKMDINGILNKILAGYQEKNNRSHEDSGGVQEVFAVSADSEDLFQQLLTKIDAELNSYVEECTKLDKSSIINLAESIGERKKVQWLFNNEVYDFNDEQLKYLLNYHDLLYTLSDSLRAQIYDKMDINGILNKILAEHQEKNNRLHEDSIIVNETHSVSKKVEKPSILAQLHEKTNSAKPTPPKKKDGIEL